ncbi:uncharacterized protein LOC131159586 isoform X1 [Malania oleifera]|uniref:uncharacterized protein LOC131159586 isoform X1 n=1 Tax=Malania oleifera TaxID=397392 RepID=UPI0025AE65AA|nr:uncharacterized protein LOC131159586 isoform X1 [Malania oleifera]
MSLTMSLCSQHLSANRTSRNILNSRNANLYTPSKNPIFLSVSSKLLASPLHFKYLGTKSPNHEHLEPFRARRSQLGAFPEGNVQAEKLRVSDHYLEAFLSIAELLCLASSAVLSIGLAVNCALSRCQKGFAGLLVDGILAWQVVMSVAAMAFGAWIRRRQWRRTCINSSKMAGVSEVNLVERVEKLDEDLRSCVTIVRVLSRQLEKLGIRFRVTRKALKGPIAETATLAQKNSVTTRALAQREDILEKELGEIQKVLLAMQEQQQKQLELILAICKAGKLLESRQVPTQERDAVERYNFTEGTKGVENNRIRPASGHKGANNDIA